jgi:hypothetical protein
LLNEMNETYKLPYYQTSLGWASLWEEATQNKSTL